MGNEGGGAAPLLVSRSWATRVERPPLLLARIRGGGPPPGVEIGGKGVVPRPSRVEERPPFLVSKSGA
jgi:hypothetical protein